MVASLAHRGPDESGAWIGADAALGIARLSIVDVAEGHQPVFTPDRSVVAVCNGEIYNYRELAAELISSGVSLRSGSDAEVIPHLYRRYGLDFVRRLRGMFAIALWDVRQGRLVLLRDRVGKKPLVYANDGERLLFASEVRALLAAGWRPEPNLGALDHVMAFGHVPIDGGAFQGLQSLPPGHVGVWQGGELALRSYWSWEPQEDKLPTQGLGDRIEAALDEAVRIRLVSERPFGSFLSGGIDSTVVTALMTRHHSGPVKTFSVGFADPSFDESGFARRVADYLGTDHTDAILEPDPIDMVTRIGDAYDQPFADSSAIATLLLSELAASEVVVALSGDGGDETFGGYERYRATAALQRINPALHTAGLLRDPLASYADRTGRRRLGRLANELRPQASLGVRYRSVMELIPGEVRSELWTVEAASQFGRGVPEAEFDRVWDSTDGLGDLDRMRATDVATYLPGDLLTKVDVASMAHSLEVRSPFLDQEVMELARSLPASLLTRDGQTKWILRQLAYRLVPKELVDRPKRGFGIPQAAWLRSPLRDMTHDLLLDSTARQRGWFNPTVVEALLGEHDAGQDRGRQIWPLLMIEVWARRWATVRA